MIFGSTTESKKKAEQAKIRAMINGVRKFAWLPIQITNGQWLWWQHYYAYYRGGTNNDGTLFLQSASQYGHCPYADYYAEADVKYRRF